MISHIHHINFVVKDLEASCKYFNKLLSQYPTIEDLPNRNVKTASYRLGDSFLILVQPLSDSGTVAKILSTKGEGIFLLSFATESIEQTLDSLEIAPLEKRKGLQDWSICDISDMDKFGTILQLTESK